MAYLRRESQYSQARRPDLILLDLNMPRKDWQIVIVKKIEQSWFTIVRLTKE
jgi:chemotaxis family two-component system response regulator Rcp1